MGSLPDEVASPPTKGTDNASRERGLKCTIFLTYSEVDD